MEEMSNFYFCVVVLILCVQSTLNQAHDDVTTSSQHVGQLPSGQEIKPNRDTCLNSYHKCLEKLEECGNGLDKCNTAYNSLENLYNTLKQQYGVRKSNHDNCRTNLEKCNEEKNQCGHNLHQCQDKVETLRENSMYCEEVKYDCLRRLEQMTNDNCYDKRRIKCETSLNHCMKHNDELKCKLKKCEYGNRTCVLRDDNCCYSDTTFNDTNNKLEMLTSRCSNKENCLFLTKLANEIGRKKDMLISIKNIATATCNMNLEERFLQYFAYKDNVDEDILSLKKIEQIMKKSGTELRAGEDKEKDLQDYYAELLARRISTTTNEAVEDAKMNEPKPSDTPESIVVFHLTIGSVFCIREKKDSAIAEFSDAWEVVKKYNMKPSKTTFSLCDAEAECLKRVVGPEGACTAVTEAYETLKNNVIAGDDDPEINKFLSYLQGLIGTYCST